MPVAPLLALHQDSSRLTLSLQLVFFSSTTPGLRLLSTWASTGDAYGKEKELQVLEEDSLIWGLVHPHIHHYPLCANVLEKCYYHFTSLLETKVTIVSRERNETGLDVE